METVNGTLIDPAPALKASARPVGSHYSAARLEIAELEKRLRLKFTLVDGESGDTVDARPATPGGDWLIRGAVCREVATRRQVTVIEDHEALVVLAVPVVDMPRSGKGRGVSGYAPVHVAVTQFLTKPAHRDEDHQQLAAALGISVAEARRWAEQQSPRSVNAVIEQTQLVCDMLAAERRSESLQAELDSVAENLAASYEELSLLYRVTENLRLSGGAEQIARLAMQWLTDVIPAQGFAILLNASAEATGGGPRGPILLTEGRCPLDRNQFARLVQQVVPADIRQPFVANRHVTRELPQHYAGVDQLILVPLAAEDKQFGWLAAFNHADDLEFGTVEASLLSSVATILGIHAGNVELYRGQTELLGGVVRALSSAIDAKDPYTRGHSDRVARVAVRLTKQLGHSLEFQQTVYLSGLLHDIGKIGIDDEVLRKPGRLTDAEYEHIKLHPEIGYKILVGLKKFDNVLPGVLHHHEAWNGNGYPHGLAGEGIPLMARILAVADAFDAMGSDRPYRKGMEDAKVDAILREGAGQQWDAEVVAAFFAAREDIREIAKRDREAYPLDLAQWALAGG